jgi:hypothetical protein
MKTNPVQSIEAKAAEQRAAATRAVDMLAASLGPDLAVFAAAFDAAAFRFGAALRARVAAGEPSSLEEGASS